MFDINGKKVLLKTSWKVPLEKKVVYHILTGKQEIYNKHKEYLRVNCCCIRKKINKILNESNLFNVVNY